MPNINDRKKLEKLLRAYETEMNTDALESILENELNKPAEEIDTGLIEDLMEILQPEEMSDKQQQQLWKRIQKKITPRHDHRNFRRLAAIAAILVLVCSFAFTPAAASPWQFLKRLLKPVAETFGIYLNYSESSSTETPNVHQYRISEDETTPVIYYDLSEVPDSYDGYAIKPGWVPEGFKFIRVSSFSEVHMQKYAFHYLRGNQELNITIAIHADPYAVVKFEYERVSGVPTECVLNDTVVTFYNNYQDENESQHVSWVNDNAYYSIRGSVTNEELDQIIVSYLEQFSE